MKYIIQQENIPDIDTTELASKFDKSISFKLIHDLNIESKLVTDDMFKFLKSNPSKFEHSLNMKDISVIFEVSNFERSTHFIS